LAITPINHPAVIRQIRRLTDIGIPVVTVNTDIKDSGRLAYVGNDSFKSGETAAGLMNLVTGGCANVGIVIGHPLVGGHTERTMGFSSRIKSHYPGIFIVGTTVNYDDDILSFSVKQKLLQEHPEIVALYLAAAGVGGACCAVKEMGLGGKIKIICHDSTEFTHKHLSEGVIVATITQQPFVQGAKPLEILLDYAGMGIHAQKLIYSTPKLKSRFLRTLFRTCGH